MRVVIDTNVLIDVARGFFGWARQVLDLCLERKIQPILSQAIENEHWLIINRLIKDEKYLHELKKYFTQAELIEPMPFVSGRLSDPEDEKFLEAAKAASASAIVTSDKHLLVLKEFEGLPILKPEDFMFWYQNQMPDNNREWFDKTASWFGLGS